VSGRYSEHKGGRGRRREAVRRKTPTHSFLIKKVEVPSPRHGNKKCEMDQEDFKRHEPFVSRSCNLFFVWVLTGGRRRKPHASKVRKFFSWKQVTVLHVGYLEGFIFGRRERRKAHWYLALAFFVGREEFPM
jgi:hypothetical protein